MSQNPAPKSRIPTRSLETVVERRGKRRVLATERSRIVEVPNSKAIPIINSIFFII